MDIKTQLNESMKDAMKSGDKVRKLTVSMVLAAVKQVEVDKRAAARRSGCCGVDPKRDQESPRSH